MNSILKRSPIERKMLAAGQLKFEYSALQHDNKPHAPRVIHEYSLCEDWTSDQIEKKIMAIREAPHIINCNYVFHRNQRFLNISYQVINDSCVRGILKKDKYSEIEMIEYQSYAEKDACDKGMLEFVRACKNGHHGVNRVYRILGWGMTNEQIAQLKTKISEASKYHVIEIHKNIFDGKTFLVVVSTDKLRDRALDIRLPDPEELPLEKNLIRGQIDSVYNTDDDSSAIRSNYRNAYEDRYESDKNVMTVDERDKMNKVLCDHKQTGEHVFTPALTNKQIMVEYFDPKIVVRGVPPKQDLRAFTSALDPDPRWQCAYSHKPIRIAVVGDDGKIYDKGEFISHLQNRKEIDQFRYMSYALHIHRAARRQYIKQMRDEETSVRQRYQLFTDGNINEDEHKIVHSRINNNLDSDFNNTHSCRVM